MSRIPHAVLTDFQLVFGFLGIALLFLVFWFFLNWMEKYAEKKEREIEKELEELEKTGELY